MYNTPTTLTRTPERAINTSPFRGVNVQIIILYQLSDKSRNINYPPVAHQIGNYFNREINSFDP